MGKLIHVSAGNGGPRRQFPTDKFQMMGTDLGFLFEGGKQFDHPGRSSLWVGGIFGDTFAVRDPHGPENEQQKKWRSPVMGRTSNTDFLTRGVVWDNFAGAPKGQGFAKRLWDYDNGGRTVIPNDVIQVPDGRYFGMGFRVKEWVNPKERITVLNAVRHTQAMCSTHANRWFWSGEPHAENWEVGRWRDDLSRIYEWPNRGRDALFQNASFLMVPNDDHIYVFGSREGRKLGNDGVYLRRAHWDHCYTDEWEFWGFSGGKWRWGRDVQPTPILRPVTPVGWIGELNAQFIDGRVVLTYSDMALGAVAVTAPRPDAPWSMPTVLVSRVHSPAQYAPSVHPWTRDRRDAYLHLSSWAQQPGIGTIDYCTQGYRVNLESTLGNLVPKSLRGDTLGLDTSRMTMHEFSEQASRLVDASAEVNPTAGAV